MKYSLKSFIVGGVFVASLTGVLISCETVDPATMSTVQTSDYSPIRLIDVNKGTPGQTIVINVPNIGINDKQSESEESQDLETDEQGIITEPATDESNPVEDADAQKDVTNTQTGDEDSSEAETTESDNQENDKTDSAESSGSGVDDSVTSPTRNSAAAQSNIDKNVIDDSDSEKEEAVAKASDAAKEKILAQARDYIDNGKYTQAITLLNGWLKTNPDDEDAKSLLEEAQDKLEKANDVATAKARQDKLDQAKAFIESGKYSNAITVLNGLLKADPNDAEAKALLEEAQKKQTKATEEATAKARQDKLDQAKAFIEGGKYSNAITVLNGLLKADPNDAEAKALLEEAQKKQKEANDAAAAKARQDKLDQAKAFIEGGKYSNAITVLNGLLKADPNDAEAKALLEEAQKKQKEANDAAAAKARQDKLAQAKSLIEGGKYSNAITVLNGLLKTDPNDAEAKVLLEEAQKKQKEANDSAAAKARQDKLAQAKSLIEGGKYSNAITVLNGLLKADPNDAEAKALLEEAQKKQKEANDAAAAKARQDKLDQAKSLIEGGKYSNAITVLNGLLKTDPNDAEAKALLKEAQDKLAKEKEEAAAKAAEAAKAKNIAQAKSTLENGNTTQAVSQLEKLAADNPDDKEIAALLKDAKSKQAAEAAAKKAAEEAAAKEAAAKEARQKAINQAKDYINQGKYDQAVSTLNSLLKSDPNDAEAKALLKEAQDKQAKAAEEAAAKARQDKLDQAKANIADGKSAQAISALNAMLKSNPNDAEAKKLLEEAQKKQTQAAEEAAAKARQDKINQAKSNIENGKPAQAISILNALLKTNPNDAEAKALLEEAQKKQTKATEEAAAKARQDKINQAKSNIENGKPAQAISILNALLKTNPNDAEAKALLEEAQKKQTQANEEAAAKAAEAAKAKSKTQAQAALKQGKTDQAVSQLEKLAAENPDDKEIAALLKEAKEKQAAEKAAAQKAEEEKAAQKEAAAKLAAEKKAAEEAAKKEAEAKLAAAKKAEEAKLAAAKKAEEEKIAAAEAEKEKEEVLVELQKFTTDWESPQLNDIQDCGYFYTSPEFGQFDMIEGEFSKKSGYVKSAYGFVFGYRKPGSNGKLYDYIRFEINTDGEYALYKWDGKTYTDLVEPNDEGTAYFYNSTTINKGYNATNKLKIQVKDGKYDVYINGRLIKKGIDFLPNGTFGVMGFFSVGQVNQEDLPNKPVVVSYRITDAELHTSK